MLNEHLARYSQFSFLDVGVSDGVTSADLALTFGNRMSKFFATDLYLSLRWMKQDGISYLYPAADDRCMMAITKRLIFYNAECSVVNPLGWWASGVFNRAPKPERAKSVALVNPRLTSLAAADPRVELAEWDVFSPWPREKVSVIRAANVLNPVYFPRERIQLAMRNLADALEIGGVLFIVDNRDSEKATLFEKRSEGLTAIDTLGGGCQATAYATL